MNKFFILILCVLFTTIITAQKSYIYDDMGRLYADSTLTIAPHFVKDFVEIERYVLPFVFSDIRYPDICLDNDVDGYVIIKVFENSDKKIDFEIVKGDSLLGGEVLRALNMYVNGSVFSYVSFRIGTYYIPFLFEIDDSLYFERLKRNNSVTIKKRKREEKRAILSDIGSKY